MNKRLDYAVENYKEFLKFAVKITRNKEVAEDILQELIVYFLSKPKNDIEYLTNHINFFIKMKYYGYYNKFVKRFEKSIDSFISQDDEKFDLYEYLPSRDDLYKSTEKKMILEKMVDEYENICYPKQREALEFALEHGHYNHPENNYITMKTNRRHAIEKLNIFAETGSYSSKQGKRPKGSKRRTKKELENVKNSINS